MNEVSASRCCRVGVGGWRRLWLAIVVVGAWCGCRPPADVVVAYVAQDQVYAGPVLQQFEGETGIRVKALYDSEAVKTVGLANRLLAEQAHPQCDLFWGNEELRTRQLSTRQIWREGEGWAAFGHRSRRMIVNTNLVPLAQAPKSLLELTEGRWRGRVALGYPLFGTTASHFLALRQHWGEARWRAWCHALSTNQPLVVDGNSVVARFVGRGEAWIGLTDSDDIQVVQNQGAPVAALPLSEESLLIPNTVAVVRGAPHPEAAERLFQYLQRAEVRRKLVEGGALEGETGPGESKGVLRPDWDRLVAEVDEATAYLKGVFLR